MENIAAIIEALILASESPLSLEKICAVLDPVEKETIRQTLDQLMADYDARDSGIGILEVAGGYQYRTRPAYAAWVKKIKGTKPVTLSPAALETLAIVAYRQPIVKAEIESIRGVDVSAPLKGLMEKKLIRIVGRKDVPGKPIIYGTTKKFLEVFNLKELTDLPTLRELKEITEHQEVYEQETINFEEGQEALRVIEEAQRRSAESAGAQDAGMDEPLEEELLDATQDDLEADLIEMEAEAETKAQKKAESDSETGLGSEPGPEPESEPETEAEPEPEPEPRQTSEPEPRQELSSESETEDTADNDREQT